MCFWQCCTQKHRCLKSLSYGTGVVEHLASSQVLVIYFNGCYFECRFVGYFGHLHRIWTSWVFALIKLCYAPSCYVWPRSQESKLWFRRQKIEVRSCTLGKELVSQHKEEIMPQYWVNGLEAVLEGSILCVQLFKYRDKFVTRGFMNRPAHSARQIELGKNFGKCIDVYYNIINKDFVIDL